MFGQCGLQRCLGLFVQCGSRTVVNDYNVVNCLTGGPSHFRFDPRLFGSPSVRSSFRIAFGSRIVSQIDLPIAYDALHTTVSITTSDGVINLPTIIRNRVEAHAYWPAFSWPSAEARPHALALGQSPASLSGDWTFVFVRFYYLLAAVPRASLPTCQSVTFVRFIAHFFLSFYSRYGNFSSPLYVGSPIVNSFREVITINIATSLLLIYQIIFGFWAFWRMLTYLYAHGDSDRLGIKFFAWLGSTRLDSTRLCDRVRENDIVGHDVA